MEICYFTLSSTTRKLQSKYDNERQLPWRPCWESMEGRGLGELESECPAYRAVRAHIPPAKIGQSFPLFRNICFMGLYWNLIILKYHQLCQFKNIVNQLKCYLKRGEGQIKPICGLMHPVRGICQLWSACLAQRFLEELFLGWQACPTG